jgi:hypothetical protein
MIDLIVLFGLSLSFLITGGYNCFAQGFWASFLSQHAYERLRRGIARSSM